MVCSPVVEMIGKWFKKTGRRNEIFLCTKFANTLDGKFNVRGDPEYVNSACDDSLERLDIDQIDLYYMHRYRHRKEGPYITERIRPFLLRIRSARWRSWSMRAK